ncbi:hypothetical protein [Phocaeicola sp.]
MKKRTLLVICSLLAISIYTFEKANSKDTYKDFLLNEVEALASDETSDGPCASYLHSCIIEQSSAGGKIYINKYKCKGINIGSCFDGNIITYYNSAGQELGSEKQGITMYCI